MRYNIESFAIENFKSIKKIDGFAINNCIYLITGESKDNKNSNNGSGKTTFVQSLLFLIFGETDETGDIREVIRTGENHFKGEIIITDGQEKYKICRSVNVGKVNKYSLTFSKLIDGEYSIIGYTHKTKKETQEKINSLICGVDSEIFNICHVSNIHNMQKIFSADVSELKDYLVTIIGKCDEEKAKSIANKLIKVGTEKQMKLGKLEALQNSINEIDNYLENNKMENLKDMLIEELKNKDKVLEKIENYKKHDELIASLNEKKKMLEMVEANVSVYKSQLNRFEYDLANLRTQEVTLNNVISEAKENLLKKGKIEAMVKQLEQAKVSKNQEEKIIEHLKEKMSVINSILKYKDVAKCPMGFACDKINNPESEAYFKSKIDAQIETTDEIKKHTKIYNDANENITKLNESIADLNAIVEKAEVDLKREPEIDIIKKGIVGKLEEIKVTEENIKSNKNTIVEYQGKIKDIESDIKEKAGISENDNNANNKMLIELNKKIDGINFTINNIRMKHSEKDNLRDEHAKLQSNIMTLVEEEADYELLKSFYKSTGITSYKVKIIMPLVEKHMNTIIKDFFGDNWSIAIRVDEKYEKKGSIDFIISINDNPIGKKTLSGAQKVIFTIAFQYALSQIADISLNFVVYDEIMGQCDPKNRNLLVNFIKMMNNTYRQIFVITHHSDFGKMFEQTIVAKYNAQENVTEYVRD